MKRLGMLLGAAALLALTPTIAARAVPPSAPEQPSQGQAPPDADAIRQRVESIESRLHPQTGDIRLPGANAVLHLGQDYYFLPADEARLVIVDGWGNPPDAAANVLGIVFQSGRHFYEPDAWGAVITYNSSGYVSDDDAGTADYAELLQQLQAGEAEDNQRRAAQGYPAQHLVGWAEQPAYNRTTHSVVWARNMQSAGVENSLNYDVRLLGRNGVLSLNMVTGMSALDSTRAAAKKFAASAEFTPGARYADYQAGIDKKAEYGIGGLIAAGAGVAVAQKLGLIGIILAFGKKFLILILALFGGAGAWFRKLFGRNKEPEAEEYYEPLPFEQNEAEVAEEAPPASEAEPRPAE